MKEKLFLIKIIFIYLVAFTACEQNYKYETVPGDPLNARIYTLENGLKVYMSVYKAEPVVATMIVVKAGGKNDPAETTGLAHYFEHLMFKGTQNFGTQNYSAEKPLLDKIEAEFEIYRTTADSIKRLAIYERIDSLSYEASKMSIPNEYVKMMSAIGSSYTNAYTSQDVTGYWEVIPSNRIESWIKVQSDRFTNPVLRGFHTELETVYEEKNMSLNNDNRMVMDAMFRLLFPNHPYSTPVLGTQEHLKNPSITNIKNFFNTYYVANNMAVCMSGDFDPDEAIKVIDRYMKALPKGNVPKPDFKPEPEMTKPVMTTVLSNEAEYVSLGFRMPGKKSPDSEVVEVMKQLLRNGKAGLIDLNLTQKQQVLNTIAYLLPMSEYSVLVLSGRPREGQTLDQVKDLFLKQIELLKKCEFDEHLLQAAIANYRLETLRNMQSAAGRSEPLTESFINDIPWEVACRKLDRLAKLTPKDIVDCANQYFGNNYAIVYKENGQDPDIKKIAKPAITPITINRDIQSQYLIDFINTKVKPIEPVFLDYKKDLTVKDLRQGIRLLYTPNTENDIFELAYRFEMGTDNDNLLGTAFNYLKYLGTSKYTPEQIQMEFYKLACSFSVSTDNNLLNVSLSGLGENMEKAIALLEELLNDPQVNVTAFNNLMNDIHKQRSDAKLSYGTIAGNLHNYAIWGPKSQRTNVPSSGELNQLKPESLIARIKDLAYYPHNILYYGPLNAQEITALLNKYHQTATTLKPLPPAVTFTQQPTVQNKVLFTHYDAKQLNLSMATTGVPYSKDLYVPRTIFNQYFSGGMNAIVFQEMREARGLAYSAWAGYSQPSKPDFNYTFSLHIATQNDKLDEAFTAFQSIVNDMPESDKAFTLAKEQMISNLRKERILRGDILIDYLNAQQFGWEYDKRKDLFEQIQKWTLQDVKKFQQLYIKDKKYVYCIAGNEKDLIPATVNKYGTLQKVTLEEIFGY